jgi:TrmH family RNA methyltransferase
MLLARRIASGASRALLRRFSTAPLFANQLTPLSKRGAKAVTAQLRALRSDAAARADKRQVVIFGRTLVEEYIGRGGVWQHVFTAPSCQLQLPPQAAVVAAPILLDAADLTYAAGVDSSSQNDACACVIPLPQLRPPSASQRRVLVLDSLSDPGNLGSIVRSALAFDFAVLLLGPGGCDPFNSKVLRSSMGAVLNADIFACDESKLKGLLEAHQRQQPKLRVLVTDAASSGCTPLPSVRIQPDESIWVFIGNEAHGVRPSLRSLGARVHVPTSGRIESLNAAAAAAILMQHVHAQMVPSVHDG